MELTKQFDWTSIVTGIFKDLQEREYRAAPGISQSELKWLDRSPAYYKALKDDPALRPKFDPYLTHNHDHKLSPAIHWHVLPEGFTLQSKANKEHYEAMMLEYDGRVIKHSDYLENCERTEALFNNPYVRKLWSQVDDTEVSLFWQGHCGQRKGRADILLTGGDTLADYKLMNDISERGFQTSLYKFGYAIQAATYLEGMNQAAETDTYKNFVFVAQESKYPYSVRLYQVSNDWLEYGRKKMFELENVLRYCLEYDKWFDVYEEPKILDMPEWVKKEMSDDSF